MRLFTADSFYDSFIELPRKIQQVTVDFQKKFKANSKSSAIHLEPINQFKDNSLRTARVTEGYRAVVGDLKNGNFALLFIGKHDDAYRWAQNKKFVWNEHTQSSQIIPIQIEETVFKEVAQQEMTIDPSSPISDVPTEKLLMIGVPEELIPLVKTFKDLNDLDNHSHNLPEDTFEKLFAVFDGENIDDLIAEIELGKVKEGEDTLLSNNNKRHLVEITDDELLAKIYTAGMEKWQIFLHPSQQKIVDANYPGTTKVSGSAGTGKTVAAIHRLKHLAQQPGAKLLFTTYTNALKEYLKGAIKLMEIPSERFELNNIDQVLRDVASIYQILPAGVKVLDYTGDNKSKALWREVIDNELSEFDEEFLYSEYIDIILYNNLTEMSQYLKQQRTGRYKQLSRKQRMEVWNLKEKYEQLKKLRNVVDRLELFNIVTNYLNTNNIRPYTNVIADEFQDFTNPELRFLRALVAEGRNDLFLTGDPFQKIYQGRKINFGSAGINVRGKRSQKLKVNYRTTEEIKRMAVSVVKGMKYDDLDGGEENNKGYISLVHGEKPSYRILNSVEEEVAQTLKIIENCETEGIKKNEICIASKTRSLYKEVLDELHRNKIQYCEVMGTSKKGDANGVNLCTFHSLKGLEYKIVILIGVNERSLPSSRSKSLLEQSKDPVEVKETLANTRSLLYVAITRGRQMVYISGIGEPTGLLEVNK